MSGRPSDGRPLAIDPTVGTSSAKALTAATAPTTATSGPGTPGARRRRPRITASEHVPTSRVRPCVSPRWVTRCQACSKKSPVPAADPEQLRQLADDDREREADDQALEHGRADELGQEAEAQQTRDQGGDARRHGQAGGERGEALGPHRGQIGDRGRRQGRGGRHGSHDEHPRAAKGCVQQQRAGRRVEAHDRRHVRDARVRERLRNQDRPEREARDQIAAKPRALIAV